MKRFAAMLAIVGFVATTSVAGVVEFDPAFSEVQPGTASVDIQVRISDLATTGGEFDNLTIVFGSDSLTFDSFVYDPAYVAATLFRTDPIDTETIFLPVEFNSGIVGGFGLTPLTAPTLIGTLTVNLPNTAGAGSEFNYFVDFSLDGASTAGLGGESDGLTGAGSISVVPEPATLCLLGIGAVSLLRRRFA